MRAACSGGALGTPEFPQKPGTQTGLQVCPRHAHKCVHACTHICVFYLEVGPHSGQIQAVHGMCLSRGTGGPLGLPWTLIPDPSTRSGGAGTFFYCLLSFSSQGGDSGSFPRLLTRNKAQRQGELAQGHRALRQSGRSQPCLSPAAPPSCSPTWCLPPMTPYLPQTAGCRRAGLHAVSIVRQPASADSMDPSWPPPLASGPPGQA